MRKRCKRVVLCCLIGLMILMCSGCHGSVEKSAFVIPEEFDTSREYEITFWAKRYQ